MIVIHRRNDHTNPFAFEQRCHHVIPRSYGHPFYHHRPSPSFYPSPFEKFEAAVMSPYWPRPSPRRHFREDVLGPMLLLAHLLNEKESKASSEKSAKTTGDSSSSQLPDESKHTVATKPEVPVSDAESSTVKLNENIETKEHEQNTKKGEEDKEKVSSEEEINPCKTFLEMFQLVSQPTFLSRRQKKSNVSETHVDRIEKEVTVTIDVSGYDAADLTVAYDSGALTVKGKHNDQSGLATTSFARRIPLNERRFHVDKISARIVDDKLVVSVPRRVPSEPRTIAIESATTEKSKPDLEQDKDNAADHNVVETKVETKDKGYEQQKETTDTEAKVDTEKLPDVDVVDRAEIHSISDVSSHKDCSVSVKTVSADDEDDEDEETYEVV